MEPIERYVLVDRDRHVACILSGHAGALDGTLAVDHPLVLARLLRLHPQQRRAQRQSGSGGLDAQRPSCATDGLVPDDDEGHQSATEAPSERRTVLVGVVHAFADNHVLQDYGPVIILRHATEDGTEFFTLYGHLSRDSLHGLEIGQTIARGQCFE